MAVTKTRAQLTNDFDLVVDRYVRTLNRSQYPADDALRFERWRQNWYDEAQKRLGIRTYAGRKRSNEDG